MKILTILLCILGGVILFRQNACPLGVQYPLLFLLLFVCSLIRAVQALSPGRGDGVHLYQGGGGVDAVLVVVCIILFKLRYL